MALAVVIEGQGNCANWELAEADMRRFWSHRCKISRFPERIVIEVGSSVRIRAKMGVERLKFFSVKAHVANVDLVRSV